MANETASVEKKNAILLIDYENLYKGAATNHHLRLTESGLEYLISTLQEQYNLPDERVLIACRYEDYPGLLNTVSGLSYKAINGLEKDKDIADAYLIAYGVEAMVEDKDDIDELILIAGDGIYASLVRVAGSIFSKINILSWENSLSGLLPNAQKRKTEIKHLEDFFSIKDGQCSISPDLFDVYALSSLEKHLITFLLPITEGFQLVPLANQMITWTHPACVEEFEGDYQKAFNYLRGCARAGGFLKEVRKPNPKGTKEVIWTGLISQHSKVKAVSALNNTK